MMDDLREIIMEHSAKLKNHDDRIELLEMSISAHELQIKNLQKLIEGQMGINNKLTELLETQQRYAHERDKYIHELNKRIIYAFTGGFTTIIMALYLIVNHLLP